MLHLSHLSPLHLRQKTQLPFHSFSPKTPFNPQYLIPKHKQPLSLSNRSPFPHYYSPIIKALNKPIPKSQPLAQKPSKNSFFAAVTLIIGTAVGPGMLGLPSATIRSGPIPSTIAIIISWVYVVSSILLIAELSFFAMKQHNAEEVSFTSLAMISFGPDFGAFVAIIYACLSFSLLIACVSGIGSLIMQRFPLINSIVAHSVVPCFVAAVIGFFPFKAIDATNRVLCSLMLLSITSLVLIGFSFGRSNLLGFLVFASWRFESILPAIPVTVLTLGFHVITPFVCRIVGDSIYDARKAIIFGGSVPLIMILSWNFVVLGLAGINKGIALEPIELLMSVNPSALPAVQGFAFAALATSLIGYAVSFPKQLVDTLRLIGERFDRKGEEKIEDLNGSVPIFVTGIVLIFPVFIASLCPMVFSRALDFAGVYANCFLFGVLPPAMAWIHRSSKKYRSFEHREVLLPGGNLVLMILFVIAVILGFWH